MVLVRDVGLEEVVKLSLTTLVEKFGYRSINKNDISESVEDYWKQVLGYDPMISIQIKGWYFFTFKEEGDASKIL